MFSLLANFTLEQLDLFRIFIFIILTRPCLKKDKTSKGRIFSRHTTLNFLAIRHQCAAHIISLYQLCLKTICDNEMFRAAHFLLVYYYNNYS